MSEAPPDDTPIRRNTIDPITLEVLRNALEVDRRRDGRRC